MRRSERLIRVTKQLVTHPGQAVSLSDLTVRLQAAKSSLSEDVAEIRDVFTEDGEGLIQSIAGAAGGVRFLPKLASLDRAKFASRMVSALRDRSRMLAGGFVYMSDLLGDPLVLDRSGMLFAEAFADRHVDVVVTVETKGIPLAVATAHYLHTPVVIVRREHRVTDGAVVSVHYVSGSSRRIQTMSISKRAMPMAARALVVDDFMKAGATANAVMELLKEFNATVVGTAVLVATSEPATKLVSSYTSLFEVSGLADDSVLNARATEWLSPYPVADDTAQDIMVEGTPVQDTDTKRTEEKA